MGAAGVSTGAFSGGGLKLVDDSDHWDTGAPPTGSKSRSKKPAKKKGPALGPVASSPAPALPAVASADGEDGEMAFLDSVLSQQSASEKAAARMEPGWKKWVSADGELSQSGSTGAEALKHAKLKAKLLGKVDAAAETRTAKPPAGKKKKKK